MSHVKLCGGKTEHRTTESPQQLFLVKGWIMFLEEKNKTTSLVFRQSIWPSLWEPGRKAVRMETLRSDCQMRGHLSEPNCPCVRAIRAGPH